MKSLSYISSRLHKTAQNSDTWANGDKKVKWSEGKNTLGMQDIVAAVRRDEKTSRNAYPGMKVPKDRPWPHDTMLGHEVRFPNSNNRTGLAYFSNNTDNINQRAREVLRKQFRNYTEDDPEITLREAIKKFDQSAPRHRKSKYRVLENRYPWAEEIRKNILNKRLRHYLENKLKIHNPNRNK